MRPVLLSLLLLTVTPAWAVDTDKDGVPDPVDPSPSNTNITGYQLPWLYTFTFTQVLNPVSVSGAGDVNNDGYADFIVGTPDEGANGASSGRVRVFSGENGAILYTFDGDSPGDILGSSAGSAGDINNDGYADLIVGAYGDDNNGSASGSARVFSGANGSILYTVNGDNADDVFGRSVSGAGDVDNDGYADFIVGAPQDDNNGTNSGSARVFSGADGSILYTFNGGSGDSFGSSVSGAGDINHDGHADLIIGMPNDHTAGNLSGSAQIFSGANGSILYTIRGDSPGDRFGSSVSNAADVNNDGFADFIIGAPLDDNNGTDSGSARVFSGANGGILYTFNGDAADDRFGSSVSGADDVNNDGYADFIVGALLNDRHGMNSGSARVFSGSDGGILYTFTGDTTDDRFGRSVSSAGDVNNDGYSDLIVGTSNSSSFSARVFSGAMFLQQTDDSDSDGLVDTMDMDDDSDSIPDATDSFPQDTDNDGIPNSMDQDADNDGIPNVNDTDDDNDGSPDTIDSNPLIPFAVDGTYRGSSIRENQRDTRNQRK